MRKFFVLNDDHITLWHDKKSSLSIPTQKGLINKLSVIRYYVSQREPHISASPLVAETKVKVIPQVGWLIAVRAKISFNGMNVTVGFPETSLHSIGFASAKKMWARLPRYKKEIVFVKKPVVAPVKKIRTHKQIMKDLARETKLQTMRCKQEKFQTLSQQTGVKVIVPKKIREHNYIGVSKSRTNFTRAYNQYQRVQNQLNGRIDKQLRAQQQMVY